MPFIKSLKFDANKHSAKHLNNLKLIIHAKQTNESDSFSDHRIAAAQLARKQQNVSLASRLMTEQIDCLYSKLLSNFENPHEDIYESIKYLGANMNVNLDSGLQLLHMESEFEAAKLLKKNEIKIIKSIEVS